MGGFVAGGHEFLNLEDYEDAVVRLRGCLFVAWDVTARQLELGRIRMHVRSIMVDQPALADVFSAPMKRAAELTLFDPQARAFQRVKVSGQILYMKGRDYFMMDGTNGVRFTLRRPVELAHRRSGGSGGLSGIERGRAAFAPGGRAQNRTRRPAGS